jgi:RNA polymerase sigma-70 factor (subfamily 1)
MDGMQPPADMARTFELVQRAQKGDGAALGALLERYQERVRALVRRRMGDNLRKELESGDMVQEAMVEVLEGFERFELRDETAFVRWLSTLVENRLRELARFHGAAKRDRAREVRLDGGDTSDDGPGPNEIADQALVSPSQEALRREEKNLLADALLTLTERHREVLVARESGADWDVVAKRMGLPSEAAARMLHTRARIALARRLGGPAPEET